VEIDLSRFASDMLTRTAPNPQGSSKAAEMTAELMITLDFFDQNAVPGFEIPAEAKAR